MLFLHAPTTKRNMFLSERCRKYVKNASLFLHVPKGENEEFKTSSIIASFWNPHRIPKREGKFVSLQRKRDEIMW